ncbi:DUF1684 domain-containing protein [Quadrisphaera sp. DSM 44207]|uniref:DUF1684 domain-containing protein n=1 Tax=Quadrisphaera sp. DSM 44207 TaxID=1881057 RepID=UPI00088B2363|nr:DUF1684 domain-containing protein [Quadrisphaera sp. DSM 44207]SDQ38569.1 hypothetical protein SAMN05428996_1495 [Quadrisphaera sp. DSM 44207]
MGEGSLTLLAWRRRVAELYAQVRAAPDPAHGHALWRAGRDALFAEHPDSPLAPHDPRRRTGLPVAPYDPRLRFTAALEPATGDAPDRLEVGTGTDGTVRFARLGRVRTPVGDLDVWWLTGYGGGVWVPVRDGGSGSASYGGGRYLLDTVKGADLGSAPGPGGAEELVLDLNFLYNPSCAYDEAWACPLAPPGNRVDVVLEVGELL